MVGSGSVVVLAVGASVTVSFEIILTLTVHVVTLGLSSTLVVPLVALTSFGWVLSGSETALLAVVGT